MTGLHYGSAAAINLSLAFLRQATYSNGLRRPWVFPPNSHVKGLERTGRYFARTTEIDAAAADAVRSPIRHLALPP